jgi:selenocysteine lyase/cysteine desulfurase
MQRLALVEPAMWLDPGTTCCDQRHDLIRSVIMSSSEAVASSLGVQFADLRRREYSRLEDGRVVYLDYTGAGLYPESLVARHAQLLASEVVGNPHSGNPTSVRSTALFERGRQHVLTFFDAPADEYTVIFTANATHALKLVGESYPFGAGDRLLLTADNHNSVLGIREFARRAGVSAEYVPILPPDMRADEPAVLRALDAGGGDHRLFAYPAQSNFSGVQHPLEWIESAHARGWDVLLDAAAFVPTNRLDLGRWRPDFVALSFYKMFGYPTGVGALLARHSALERLRRPWFAGGTITVASVQADRHYLAPGGTGFEDGTVNFLAVPAVDLGLSFAESVGVEAIHRHVQALAAPLIEALLSPRHRNGRRVAVLYGPDRVERRGATLAFNFVDPEGEVIDPTLVERLAGVDGISLRTGCFCNPGAGEAALGLSRAELEACFRRNAERMSYDEFRRCLAGNGSGAVRVSLGLASNRADVEAMAVFARRFVDADHRALAGAA